MGGREEEFDGEDVPLLLAALISQKRYQGRHRSLWQLNICNSRHGASLQSLGAAPPTAARCVFVAFLLGFFPQVFIPFILRWS